jgi:hypothetical protein
MRVVKEVRGVVLVVALLLVLVAGVIGVAAVTSSDIEMMIAGNQRSLQQVFDSAEAGIEAGVGAFFLDAPPGGAVRPPGSDSAAPPWGAPASESLKNGCTYAVWVTDMQASKPPPPGYDPGVYRSFFYRIRSIGRETGPGTETAPGLRETDHVVSVVYRVK